MTMNILGKSQKNNKKLLLNLQGEAVLIKENLFPKKAQKGKKL
jgi:hypothetical protein